MVTVLEPNGISIWFKKRHHDHIPFNVKGNRNKVFSVYIMYFRTFWTLFQDIPEGTFRMSFRISGNSFGWVGPTPLGIMVA